MRAKLIQIGNSQGVRLPKSVIDQCHLEGELSLDIEGSKLIISSTRQAREGWSEKFRAMGPEEAIQDPMEFSNEFDQTEWEW